MRLLANMGLGFLLAGVLHAAGPGAAAPRYGRHALAARSQRTDLAGNSGVVASRQNADVYWTLDDHGGTRVHAFRLSDEDRRTGVALDLGYVKLRRADCSDWEDIAVGPGNILYVFDGGDNPPCKRKEKRIYRFREPPIVPGTTLQEEVPAESIAFDYPDPARPGRPAKDSEHRYDAECLMVHPTTGDLYVVTKRDTKDQATARVYKLEAAKTRWSTKSTWPLSWVADLSAGVPGMVTGGDISSDGRRVVLRNYLTAFEFTLPDGQEFDAVFRGPPRTISLFGEPQGEGICYALNGDLITTSEAAGLGPKFPVYRVPRLDAPATRPAGGSPARGEP